MSGTTPILGLPYPTDADFVALGDEAIQALADAVDNQLGGGLNAAVAYAASVATAFEGSRVYRFGKLGLLKFGFTLSAGKAAGATLLTVPAGFLPPAAVACRGVGWQVSGAFWPATLTDAGVLYSEVALSTATSHLGTLSFPIG